MWSTPRDETRHYQEPIPVALYDLRNEHSYLLSYAHASLCTDVPSKN